MAEFSDRLAEVMSIREKRAIDVANALGLSRSVISQYLSGKIIPKSKRTYELAKYLHCDPAWLMGLDVPMEKMEMEPLDLSGMTPDQVRRVMAYVELVRKGEL